MKIKSVITIAMRNIKRRAEREGLRFIHREHLSAYRDQVNKICAEKKQQPIFLFSPGLSWDLQLFQRPQQLARSLANEGCLVFYLEPKPRPSLPPFSEMKENLYWANVPVDAFSEVPNLWLYLLTWSIDIMPGLDQPKLWYDVVDDLSTFAGDPVEIERNHRERIMNSRLLTVTARNLYEQVAAINKAAILSPNAVDVDHFSRTSHTPPVDLRLVIANKQPIVAYHGAFARWFDYPLVLDLVHRNKDLNFLLIGPDLDGLLQNSGILGRENVFWVGEKPYEILPDYLCFADAGMIPFILSPITHSTSPLKMFEYMAMGKPIVATAMQELLQYPEVLIGEGTEGFSLQIRKALSQKNDPVIQSQIKGVARKNSWQSRAEKILNTIHVN